MRRALRESGDSYQANNVERIVATTNVYDIKTIGAQGWAETFEDITGAEEHRERHMVFCVFNPPAAVCGLGIVAKLADERKGDLTPHALKIIQSIEFLPDEPQAHSKEPASEPKSDVKP